MLEDPAQSKILWWAMIQIKIACCFTLMPHKEAVMLHCDRFVAELWTEYINQPSAASLWFLNFNKFFFYQVSSKFQRRLNRILSMVLLKNLILFVSTSTFFCFSQIAVLIALQGVALVAAIPTLVPGTSEQGLTAQARELPRRDSLITAIAEKNAIEARVTSRMTLQWSP